MDEYHLGRRSYMLLHRTLYPRRLEIDEAAQEYLDTMILRVAATAGVTEKLKAHDLSPIPGDHYK